MRKISVTTLVLVLLVVALAIATAVTAHRNTVLDDKLAARMVELRQVWNPNVNTPPDEVFRLPTVEEADRSADIDLNSQTDADAMRERLRDFLFGPAGPAAKLLTVAVRPAEQLLKEVRYEQIVPLADTDQLVFEMAAGLRAVVLYHRPKAARVNKVMLYHKGHGSDYAARFPVMRTLLQAGWDVAELAMPIVNENQQNIAFDSPHYGPIVMSRHDDFWFIDLPAGSPLRYYIEPTLATIDYTLQQHPDAEIHVAGLSGGGWSATLAGVVDARIKTVTSVAGSWPFHLVTTYQSVNGDYELTNPELYRIASPLELYTLAANGAGRTYLQIFNVNDTCCFAGTTSAGFKDAVAGKVAQLGAGHYEQFLDDSSVGHTIGVAALERMVKLLKPD